MNGRVYDYKVGRFLSVDPIIHGNGNSQGINPYSYILNNPLSGTDPTGYAPCAASRLESVCDRLPPSNGGNGSNLAASNTAKMLNSKYGGSESNGASASQPLTGSDVKEMMDMLGEYQKAKQGNMVLRDRSGREIDISTLVAANDIVGPEQPFDAQKGLKPTEAEYKLIAEGKLAEMWQGRCAAGDPIGCVGFATWGDPADVIAMHGKVDGAYWVGVGATVRFNARNGLLTGNPELLLNADALNSAVLSFGKAIATAHLDATSADLSGRHYFLSAPEITNYHHAVFDQFNVSRRWYGGSYGTGRHEPLLEPFYCRPSCDSN